MESLKSLREKAILLRKKGKTYSEITRLLNQSIAQSTLSYWMKNVQLSRVAEERRKKYTLGLFRRSQRRAVEVNRKKRETYLRSVRNRNAYFSGMLDHNVGKIILAMLYFGEGAKKKGRLLFGNSDAIMVRMFLTLLRKCYEIDEGKFRCTVQCRADQNIHALEQFWSRVTKIPLSRFYPAQVDPRTIGKKTKKPNYKGVCRIDYFSSDIFYDLMAIAEILAEAVEVWPKGFLVSKKSAIITEEKSFISEGL